MSGVTAADRDLIEKHRRIWLARPELRYVYQKWFRDLLSHAESHSPIVELGSGAGFLKEYAPGVIATDIVPNPWIDAVCDAVHLPFSDASIGSLIFIDVLHHLPRPLQFIKEASRVLKPDGRLIVLEPWITPFSYLLYRYLHHEECSLNVDLNKPFGEKKNALTGNAAIPYRVLRNASLERSGFQPVLMRKFVGLPYLATFGFQASRAIPRPLIRLAEICEVLCVPLRFLAATRVMAVWQLKNHRETGTGS